MTGSLDTALLILFLVVGAWTVIFGSAGAILAPAAGMARTLGLVIGTLLGPIGVGLLLWRGRNALATIDPSSTGPEPPDRDGGAPGAGAPPPIEDQFRF
jgi:hypothetical protein